MTYNAKVIAGGKIVIPAEFRREFGIKDGDSLVIERDDLGHMVIKTYAQVVAEVQHVWRGMIGDDYSVDQFLDERRAEAELEENRYKATVP